MSVYSLVLYFIAIILLFLLFFFFFFNDTATTEIYTLSLHDALPISPELLQAIAVMLLEPREGVIAGLHLFLARVDEEVKSGRSEEHTSELQSLTNLVCRLLLEKKKK